MQFKAIATDFICIVLWLITVIIIREVQKEERRSKDSKRKAVIISFTFNNRTSWTVPVHCTWRTNLSSYLWHYKCYRKCEEANMEMWFWGKWKWQTQILCKGNLATAMTAITWIIELYLENLQSQDSRWYEVSCDPLSLEQWNPRLWYHIHQLRVSEAEWSNQKFSVRNFP